MDPEEMEESKLQLAKHTESMVVHNEQLQQRLTKGCQRIDKYFEIAIEHNEGEIENLEIMSMHVQTLKLCKASVGALDEEMEKQKTEIRILEAELKVFEDVRKNREEGILSKCKEAMEQQGDLLKEYGEVKGKLERAVAKAMMTKKLCEIAYHKQEELKRRSEELLPTRRANMKLTADNIVNVDNASRIFNEIVDAFERSISGLKD